MANRPEGERPGLLLAGRPGQALHDVGGEARAAGAAVHEISCDLASLADVRAADATVKDLLTFGAVRPLRAWWPMPGSRPSTPATPRPTVTSFTFAVNYLAHAQLIDGLLDSFTRPARIVLAGSSTYYASWVRRLIWSRRPNPAEPVIRSGQFPLIGQPPFILGWDISGVIEDLQGVYPGSTSATRCTERRSFPRGQRLRAALARRVHDTDEPGGMIGLALDTYLPTDPARQNVPSGR